MTKPTAELIAELRRFGAEMAGRGFWARGDVLESADRLETIQKAWEAYDRASGAEESWRTCKALEAAITGIPSQGGEG